MKYTSILIISIFIFIISGCENQIEDNPCGDILCGLFCQNGFVLDENGCEICECIVSVFAGVYDDTFNYYEFTPPLEIEMLWDSQNLYGEGEGFIDIDFDGNDDIKFDIGGYNQQNLNEYPQIFNHCLLTPFNGFEIAYDTDWFPIGMGQSSSVDVISQFIFNDGIDNTSNWFSDSNSWMRMFYENPSILPYGSWYYATETYYIGIKKNDKYGWIEVDMSDGYFPKIISYAIEQ